MRQSFAPAFLLAAAIALTGCADSHDVPASAQDTPDLSPAQPPPGAIAVSETVYMVPAGVDESGCAMFTAWSATDAVLTVIQYQTPAGGFTPVREAADCP